MISDLIDPAALTLGMVGLINPCGFALLPAYLGFFLGMNDDGERSTIRSLNQAQKVGLSLSAGFLAVFGTIGLFLATTIGQLDPSWLHRASVALGVGLVILGIAMLAGFELNLRIPKLNRGGGDQSITSMFLFGVSYAIASLGCTLAPFIGQVANSFSRVETTDGASTLVAEDASFIQRFGSSLSYGIGMALLATVLTLAVGFGKKGIVNRFRTVLPYINRISAVILLVVGTYVALYGIWSIQVFNPEITTTPWIDSIVTTAEGGQRSFEGWLRTDISVAGLELERVAVLGWVFLVINVALIVAGFLVRSRDKTPTDEILVES